MTTPDKKWKAGTSITARDGISLMNAEFDALEKLQKATRRMHSTPVVDDDYPEMRHYYESALKTFIDALYNNRGDFLWRNYK